MFRIGDFSRIARVSCRLLRHYDELGLLKPARIEPDTGYRFYSAAQLPRLNRILVLRDLGMSLEQIAQALREDLGAAELRGMLLMRRAETARTIEAESQRLRQIEARISQIDGEDGLAPDDVVLKGEPARRLLSTRQTVASFSEGLGIIGELLASRVAGQLVAIAHAVEFEPDAIDVEFGFFVDSPPDRLPRLAGGRTLALRELPAVERVAACVRIGPPQEAHLATARIGRYIESNGYRISGPTREVFLQRPASMAEAVVEMQFPVDRA